MVFLSLFVCLYLYLYSLSLSLFDVNSFWDRSLLSSGAPKVDFWQHLAGGHAQQALFAVD